MERNKTLRILALIAGLTLSALLVSACAATEIPAGAAQVTFVVHCYDVGADALQGRPGVLAVERGWSGFHEVDRVAYDPKQVTVEQMEGWLREAGTYVRTMNPFSAEPRTERPQ